MLAVNSQSGKLLAASNGEDLVQPNVQSTTAS
jgi:hypothetical protein